MGDLDDEEIQLRIALLESEAASLNEQKRAMEQDSTDVDEDLLRAIEESRLSFETMHASEEQEEDLELLRAIQQSRIEEESRNVAQRPRRRDGPLGEFASSDELWSSGQARHNTRDPRTPSSDANGSIDDDLAFAQALSMSEL